MDKTFINLDDKSYAIIVPNNIIFLTECSFQEAMDFFETVDESNYADYEKREEFEHQSSIAFIPTFNCNLNCIYCYARGGESQEVISLQTAQTALKYIKSLNLNDDCLNLYLVGGGEPLVNFDLVKKIVSYAETLFTTVKLHIVTNGTFNDDILLWLVNKNADIRISYDGVRHDTNRKYRNGDNSSIVVLKNIKKLIAYNASIIVQCVITKSTVDSMIETIQELNELHVPIVKFEPALPTDVSRGNEDLCPEPRTFANALLKSINYIADNRLNIKIDTGYFSKPSNNYYCGMSNGNFTVTPNAYVIPCVECARETDPYFSKLYIGKIQNGLFTENTQNKEFLKTLHYKNYKSDCYSCNLRLMCLGGCPMANIWQAGIPVKKSTYTCAIVRNFLPNLLLAITKNEHILDVIIEHPTIYKEDLQ